MGRIAWLIVSDLHLYYKNISSHLDYVQEMLDVRQKILNVAIKYRKDGYEKVNLLLLGDVFHRSYTKVDTAVYDSSFFMMWHEKLGECFSVVGNHELSFYKSNPFFSLVRDIESENVTKISNKVWSPNGLLPIIRVVDRLDCGNVSFYFNHNQCGVQKPEPGNVNIGLFHQDIVCKEIVGAMEAKLGSDVFANTIDFDSTDVFSGYNYCFFGHMHKVYGTWQLDSGTVLCYLASLGRTNVSEVNNTFLQRNIPVVKIEGETFTGIDDNFITLPSFEECINPIVAQENKEQYEVTKEKQAARQYVPLQDNPIDGIKQYFAADAKMCQIIDGLLIDEIDPIGRELKNRLGGILNDY